MHLWTLLLSPVLFKLFLGGLENDKNIRANKQIDCCT